MGAQRRGFGGQRMADAGPFGAGQGHDGQGGGRQEEAEDGQGDLVGQVPLGGSAQHGQIGGHTPGVSAGGGFGGQPAGQPTHRGAVRLWAAEGGQRRGQRRPPG